MSEDFFGFAQGKEGDRYQGLVFGSAGQVRLDDSSLIVHRDRAVAQRSQERGPPDGDGGSKSDIGGPKETSKRHDDASPVSREGGKRSVTRFYATKELNPQKARLDFVQVLDEVLLQLTSRHSTFVNITVEIQAADVAGFDDAVQRTLKENCSALGFKQFDFSSD